MENRNEHLWKMAQARVGFKKHLLVYCLVNGFLILIWFFTLGYYNARLLNFWPVWPIMGWGIGVLVNYINAYLPLKDSIQEEYQKLLSQQRS